MDAVAEDWLISFAYSDWDSMGSLGLHANEKKRYQATVESLPRKKATRQLIDRVGSSRSIRTRLSRFQFQAGPCAQLFLLTLETIHKIRIPRLSHDLTKACLIILSVLQSSIEHIIDSDEYTSKAVFFLKGLGEETFDLENRSEPQTKDELLCNIQWRIHDEPWRAIRVEGGRAKPVYFSETLFDHDVSLVVSDDDDVEEKSIAVCGRTVYDILKTIYEFYRQGETGSHTEIEAYYDSEGRLEEYDDSGSSPEYRGWNNLRLVHFEGISALENSQSSWFVNLASC